MGAQINDVLEELSSIEGALQDTPFDEPCSPGSGHRYIVSESARQLTEEPYGEKANPGYRGTSELEELDTYDPDKGWTDLFEVPPELRPADLAHELAKNDDGDFSRKLQLWGLDALAHYVPFHYVGIQHGIYLHSLGVSKLWLSLYQSGWRSSKTLQEQLGYCMAALMRHEAFHFEAEQMVSNLEMITREPLYIRAKEILKEPADGIHEKEEALANAYMLRGFRYPSRTLSGSGISKYLKAFTLRMPRGYRDAIACFEEPYWSSKRRKLSYEYYATASVKREVRTVDLALLYPSVGPIDTRKCPVVFDDNDNLFSKIGIVPLIDSIPEVGESEKFKKQLSKMKCERIQKEWLRTKTKLAVDVQQRSLDFKQWSKGGADVFSVRVNREARAHIRKLWDNCWLAEEIGHHDQMGH